MDCPKSPRLALALLAFTATAGAQAASYHLVDLGAYTTPIAINSQAGDIAGLYNAEAAVYRDGHGKLLPDPGGGSSAMDINEGGDIVGSTSPLGQSYEQPVMWIRGGGRLELPLPSGALGGQGIGVTREQVVFGFYYPADYQGTGDPRCFRWSAADGAVDIGLPPRAHGCLVYGANAVGQAVGESYVGKRSSRAFLYDNGTFRNLGTLDGGTYAWAESINRRGHIVGGSEVASGDEHAFLWSGGAMKDIGADPKLAYNFAASINDRGEIVGTAWATAADNDSVAARFADGQVIDLNTEVDDLADWHLLQAYDINNDGVIVGLGKRGDVGHGFELVPLPDR